MIVLNQNKNCNHNIFVNIQGGTSLVTIRPFFSYDSQYIIIASGKKIKVFSVRSGECVQILTYHQRPIVSIRENKKNNLQIFSCSDDGFIVRWDYIDGKILQVYNLEQKVNNFYAPTIFGPFYITKKFKHDYRLYSLKLENDGSKNIELILKNIQPDERTVDFGSMGKYCASISGNSLTIYKCEEKTIKVHKTGERKLTCVVCHPKEFILATGDDHGRIIVWSNALDSNHPIKSVYHWHSLPVSDLAFSFEGSHIYSGGGEAVLVKWNLFSEERFFLPRMGSPILHISVSLDNQYVLTAHQDNTLQVVDAQRNIVQVIQGLTRCQSQPNVKILSVGLLYDIHLKALVMNGRPGHLQFYDICMDKQLFNLDITSKNLISQERDFAILNMDIQKAAIDELGVWLATAEYWCSKDTSPQIWLKFWMYDSVKQTFILNTNVILPHNKELNAIVFRPQSVSPLAATTSNDGRFKIWSLCDSVKDEKQSWSCEGMGCYRDLPAGSACFSEEGSLLAVAFGSVATLWNVEGTALKAVLCNDQNKNDIKQLLFGHQHCCHFLICQDGTTITVWNVVTLSIAWIVRNEVQVLAADALTCSVAAFCKNQNLIIFTPDNPQPICSFVKVSETPIVSAIFVPKPNAKKVKSLCFHHKSQLFFINEAQNLLTLSESDAVEKKTLNMKMLPNVVETPFGLLQADSRISNVKKVEPHLLNISTHEEMKDIISTPTLQNPLSLCSVILPSLLIQEDNHETSTNIMDDQEIQHPKYKAEDEISLEPLKLEDEEFKIPDFSFLQTMLLEG